MNTKAIKCRMKKMGITQKFAAHILKIAQPTISQKINQKREFKPKEIKAMAKMLRLVDSELVSLFFSE